MIFVPLLIFGGVLALIWSVLLRRQVHDALVDSLPPMFHEYPYDQYVADEFAPKPSTPLAVQADYLRSLIGGCLFALCISLSWFIGGNVFAGCFFLLALIGTAIVTFRAWKAYKANCNRAMTHAEKDEQ
jgi:hypothetical protein